MSMELQETIKIGENDYGYQFGVGRYGDQWVGFALGTKEGEDRPSMMFVLPNVADERDGLGCRDRDKAIKLTGATAQYPSHGYGGISRWFIDERLRVIDPSEFVCAECDTVGCNESHDLDYVDFDA